MLSLLLSYLWLAGLGLIVVASVVADALRGFPEQDDVTHDAHKDWMP